MASILYDPWIFNVPLIRMLTFLNIEIWSWWRIGQELE